MWSHALLQLHWLVYLGGVDDGCRDRLSRLFSYVLLFSGTCVEMSCFSERRRRTSPLRGSSRNDLVPSKLPRMNGWSWPPQAFQVVGWLVYSFFAIVGFGIYIPLLPLPWNHVLYSVSFNTQLRPGCYYSWVCSRGSFRVEYGADIIPCCGFLCAAAS